MLNEGIKNFKINIRYALVSLLAVFMVGCSAVSTGNIEYVEKYITENVNYEIDSLKTKVYEKRVGISIKSSSVLPDDFVKFAEQSISVAKEALNNKGIPFNFIEVAVTNSTGDVTTVSFNTQDGEKGYYSDNRFASDISLQDVPVSDIQASVEEFLAERKINLDTDLYIQDKIRENCSFRVDNIGINKASDGNLKTYITTNIGLEDMVAVTMLGKNAEQFNPNNEKYDFSQDSLTLINFGTYVSQVLKAYYAAAGEKGVGTGSFAIAIIISEEDYVSNGEAIISWSTFDGKMGSLNDTRDKDTVTLAYDEIQNYLDRKYDFSSVK